MTVDEYRAMADRCRELLRVATRDDIRQQLRQWTEDFDAEADTLENEADYSSGSREGYRLR